jgi:hypothetical protein
VHFASGVPSGSFQPALRTYTIRLHGIAARAVRFDGAPARGWKAETDRFGVVTVVTVDARNPHQIDAR